MPYNDLLSMKIMDSVNDIYAGQKAMELSGVQQEFVSHNMLQAQGMEAAVILRAGGKPAYNQKRSAKSGLNLTKTSNHGLLKGALAAEKKFTRRASSDSIHFEMLGHHEKDQQRLESSVKNVGYQHIKTLSVSVIDIINELGQEGDLEVSHYDAERNILTLAYKEDKALPGFDGDFVLFLDDGTEQVASYSRPWERPEYRKDWDPETKTIRKQGQALDVIPEEIYKNLFNKNFELYYRDVKEVREFKPVKVFANTPRTVREFLNAMDESHPQYQEVARCHDLQEVLDILSEEDILAVYDQASLIVTGDWDGLALGHLVDINEQYLKVYNTFDEKNKVQDKTTLLQMSQKCFEELKQLAETKSERDRNMFERSLIKMDSFESIVTETALERAGCITPYEFLFQQLINFTYRQDKNQFYGMQLDLEKWQALFDSLRQMDSTHIDAKIQAFFLEHGISKGVQLVMDEHLKLHLQKASIGSGDKSYTLPHPHFDENISDLYQHGFDMRNPYGCNLEGAWLMILPDGVVLYGETQEKLIEVMLVDGFLEHFHIDINHGADMSKGWYEVIQKQIGLEQRIPAKTLEAFYRYEQAHQDLLQKHLVERRHSDGDLPLRKESLEQKFRMFKGKFQEKIAQMVDGFKKEEDSHSDKPRSSSSSSRH